MPNFVDQYGLCCKTTAYRLILDGKIDRSDFLVKTILDQVDQDLSTKNSSPGLWMPPYREPLRGRQAQRLGYAMGVSRGQTTIKTVSQNRLQKIFKHDSRKIISLLKLILSIFLLMRNYEIIKNLMIHKINKANQSIFQQIYF